MRTLLLCVTLAAVACGPRHAPAPEPAARPVAPPAAPPVEPGTIRVDHAWVKGAPGAAEQARRRAQIETLRTKVQGGAKFVVAWDALGADGDAWHVAEGETYEVEVVPERARELPVGAVSPVIPGDGGFHLFRILAR